MSQPTPETTIADEALTHLGHALDMLIDLSPMDQCQAFVDAVAFYNTHRPECRVERHSGYLTKLVSIGPLDAIVAVREGCK